MTYSKQRGKRTFVPSFPEMHDAKRKRVLFSILNITIVVLIVILLTFTILVIL